MDKATSDSGKLSVEKFINEMKRNRKQAETFFRGEHGKQLDGIMKYLDSTQTGSYCCRKPTDRANGSWSSSADNSSCVCYKSNVCKSCGSWSWYRYGWQGYESRAMRNALLKLANTPKGSTAYDRAIRRVSETLTPLIQASSEKAQQ